MHKDLGFYKSELLQRIKPHLFLSKLTLNCFWLLSLSFSFHSENLSHAFKLTIKLEVTFSTRTIQTTAYTTYWPTIWQGIQLMAWTEWTVNIIQYFHCIADMSIWNGSSVTSQRVTADTQNTLRTSTHLQVPPFFIRKKKKFWENCCFLFLLFSSQDTNHKMKFPTA